MYFMKHKTIFTFCIIAQYTDGTGCWNPSLCKTRNSSSCIVNTMAADGLVMQGARASGAMVLTKFSWNILVSAPEELKFEFRF